VKTLAAAMAVADFLPIADARARLGPVADALLLDQTVGSTRAGREVGWRPSRPSVLREIEGGYLG
jgi:hypothetical protein